MALGEVQKIKLDFTLDEKTLTEKGEGAANGKAGKDRGEARVLFASSKPEHCFVKCQN